MFSMVMIRQLGTQQSQQLLILLAGLSGLLMLLASYSRHRRPAALWRVASVAALVAVATISASAVPGLPAGLIAYGRNLPTYLELPEFLYVGEGMNASVAVSEEQDGTRNFHVSGKVVASSLPQDMRLQRMLCHIPALLHPEPKRILIVGCGAGVTAGSFVVYPSVTRIVICEIEPLIPPAANRYFGVENYGVMEDPRVEIVYDDARHFILTTDEKFDIITSDPIHPWVKGAAALYSQEYFQLCQQRLEPGGIVTQWVPLYETNEAAAKSQLGTFFQVFPDGTVWGNTLDGEGYDVVLLGQLGPNSIDVAGLQARLEREDYTAVLLSLGETNQASAIRLLSTYAGRGRDLVPWTRDAQINQDRNLRLQYLAGLGLNAYESVDIYRLMLACRQYPQELFHATVEQERQLRMALEAKR